MEQKWILENDHSDLPKQNKEFYLKPPERVTILRVGIDLVTMQSALRIIEKFIVDRKPKMVITADASGIVLAQSDREWQEILERADLVTPDSAGVVWASRKLGNPLEERVSGVDLVDQICRLGDQKQYRIFFLGGENKVAYDAAKKLNEKYPGFVIVGAEHGYFEQSDEAKIVENIRNAKPDILFVGMGIPIQEKFIYRNLYELNVPVSMGVGGSFDVLSGRVKRAPRWFQKLRLEWFWRLLQNPKKWKKVLTLPKFWWLVQKSPRTR